MVQSNKKQAQLAAILTLIVIMEGTTAGDRGDRKANPWVESSATMWKARSSGDAETLPQLMWERGPVLPIDWQPIST